MKYSRGYITIIFVQEEIEHLRKGTNSERRKMPGDVGAVEEVCPFNFFDLLICEGHPWLASLI